MIQEEDLNLIYNSRKQAFAGDHHLHLQRVVKLNLNVIYARCAGCAVLTMLNEHSIALTDIPLSAAYIILMAFLYIIHK